MRVRFDRDLDAMSYDDPARVVSDAQGTFTEAEINALEGLEKYRSVNPGAVLDDDSLDNVRENRIRLELVRRKEERRR